MLLVKGTTYKQIKLFVDNFLVNYNSVDKEALSIFQSWKNRIKKKLELHFRDSNTKYKIVYILLILY